MEFPVFSMGQTEGRMAELKLTLPQMPRPLATYVPIVQTGNLVFLSGHVPFKPDMKTCAHLPLATVNPWAPREDTTRPPHSQIIHGEGWR